MTDRFRTVDDSFETVKEKAFEGSNYDYDDTWENEEITGSDYESSEGKTDIDSHRMP